MIVTILIEDGMWWEGFGGFKGGRDQKIWVVFGGKRGQEDVDGVSDRKDQ